MGPQAILKDKWNIINMRHILGAGEILGMCNANGYRGEHEESLR